MADVDRDTVARLWNQTRDYSWDSLRQGLRIIFSQGVIAQAAYDDMLYAINKLENLGQPFPPSVDDLYSKMSYYM